MVKTVKQKTIKLFRKTTLLWIVCLFFQNIAQAQSSMQNGLSENNVYLDAGIHFAGQASINYERLIQSGEKVTWYGRVGAGAAGFALGDSGPGGLGAITMLTGKNNRHFELNAGAFIGKDSSYDDNSSFVFPLLDVGYRYQKPEGGFIFRAKVGILGLGIGLGYAF